MHPARDCTRLAQHMMNCLDKNRKANTSIRQDHVYRKANTSIRQDHVYRKQGQVTTIPKALTPSEDWS
ncbi:hypothetical protein DPMN_053969 [Dreissena polymorpha]|uniref:Uncharacterized protein n=1 Tax=Dreissena polymorpha TaxID=45954 RepID=A0A9D4HSP5_DREPO|nr:hypothetical protein DPMN_053969 [Dreissena polymorpha]